MNHSEAKCWDIRPSHDAVRRRTTSACWAAIGGFRMSRPYDDVVDVTCGVQRRACGAIGLRTRHRSQQAYVYRGGRGRCGPMHSRVRCSSYARRGTGCAIGERATAGVPMVGARSLNRGASCRLSC